MAVLTLQNRMQHHLLWVMPREPVFSDVQVKSNEPGVGPRYRITPLQRDLSFDKGFFVCLRALQLLTQHNQGCIIVGVAGEHLPVSLRAVLQLTKPLSLLQNFLHATVSLTGSGGSMLMLSLSGCV
jgi:hypothetical protein